LSECMTDMRGSAGGQARPAYLASEMNNGGRGRGGGGGGGLAIYYRERHRWETRTPAVRGKEKKKKEVDRGSQPDDDGVSGYSVTEKRCSFHA
jgi:hypothetical protein